MIFFSGPEETQLEAAKLGFRTRLDDPVRGHGLRKLPGELPMNPAPDCPFVHGHLRQFKYCNRQPSLLEPQMLTCLLRAVESHCCVAVVYSHPVSNALEAIRQLML